MAKKTINPANYMTENDTTINPRQAINRRNCRIARKETAIKGIKEMLQLLKSEFLEDELGILAQATKTINNQVELLETYLINAKSNYKI